MGTATIIVCGGRDFCDQDYLNRALDQGHAKVGFRAIHHGGARGADTLAGIYGQSRGIPVVVHPAHWNTEGRGAGYRRNERMLNTVKPDYVVAFPGGVGTAHMVRIAQAAGYPVKDFRRRPSLSEV